MNESRRQYHHRHHFWRKLMGIVVIISILLVGNHWWYQHNHQRPSRHQYPIMGVSLNQNDGSFDFQELKKLVLISFIFVRHQGQVIQMIILKLIIRVPREA